MKGEIIGCMVDNINDQNRESSLMALMSVFDLSSDEDLVSRCEKLSELYDLYGIVNEHLVPEKWNGFEIRTRKGCAVQKENFLITFVMCGQILTSLACSFIKGKKTANQ